MGIPYQETIGFVKVIVNKKDGYFILYFMKDEVNEIIPFHGEYDLELWNESIDPEDIFAEKFFKMVVALLKSRGKDKHGVIREEAVSKLYDDIKVRANGIAKLLIKYEKLMDKKDEHEETLKEISENIEKFLTI